MPVAKPVGWDPLNHYEVIVDLQMKNKIYLKRKYRKGKLNRNFLKCIYFCGYWILEFCSLLHN